jgi:hypothetical protein
VRVTRQIAYLYGGGHSFSRPKSRAGRPAASFPDLIVPDVREHLDGLGSSAALAFTSPTAGAHSREWAPAGGVAGYLLVCRQLTLPAGP